METIVVIAIVGLAVVAGALFLWRQVTGRGGACGGCKSSGCPHSQKKPPTD